MIGRFIEALIHCGIDAFLIGSLRHWPNRQRIAQSDHRVFFVSSSA
jgi:hypothetical protein